MPEIIFKTAFALLWICYIAIRVPFTKSYKLTEKSSVVSKGVEQILLVLLSIGLMGIPAVWTYTTYLDRFNINFPVWLRILGCMIAAISLFYFRRIHQALGINWSPTLEIRKGHELVVTGPYKKIRHPMYAQIWLWAIAQTLIISNSVAGFSGLAVWAVLYMVRVPREENMMKEKFGDSYLDYMRKTGRILPRVMKTKK